ncbi:MAG TPA: GWxTD domain-containing protein [Candidatus Acidoferrum sp.]|jgi:hypothetical protein|nr:GWxTD domain-containing protein [Candidatus Acidoferrum sp.]
MSSFRRPSGLCLSLLNASVPFPLASAVVQAPPTLPPLPQSSPSWPDPAVKEIYKKWLEEDVAWITTGQERADFVKLSTDKQRDKFVVAFWERRNPTPGSSENKFKEQHYRRLRMPTLSSLPAALDGKRIGDECTSCTALRLARSDGKGALPAAPFG